MARMVPISFTRCSVAITMALLMIDEGHDEEDHEREDEDAAQQQSRTGPPSRTPAASPTTLSPSPAASEAAFTSAQGVARAARIFQDEGGVEGHAAVELVLRVDARRAGPSRSPPAPRRRAASDRSSMSRERVSARRRRGRAPEERRLRVRRADTSRGAHRGLEPAGSPRPSPGHEAVEVAEGHEVHDGHHPGDAGLLDPLELEEAVDLHVDGVEVAALRRAP